MCWVALDRAIRLAEKRSFAYDYDRWRRVRDEIFADAYDNLWDGELGAFVQYRGAKTLDASALLVPLVRFLSPYDPRWLSTLDAIEKHLVTDTMVYRYRNRDGHDGLSGEEGTFSVCSFWYVECLCRGGQVDKAELYPEKMLGYGNHLGLISAAFEIDRALANRSSRRIPRGNTPPPKGVSSPALAIYDTPHPLKFDNLGLHPDILDGLDDMGFVEATPIQAQAIPAILDGKDVLAIAQTGTGKTGAFLLPVLDRLCDHPHKDVDTLIITPTRELAMQIEGQIVGFSYHTGISSVSVYGGRDGHALDAERKAMKRGVDMIVATPGRLKTHLQMGHLDLSKVRTLILDEADRMLDMGFIDDIQQIVAKLSKDRQTLLFSATFPPKIQKLARELMRQPIEEIRIAISKPPESIKQQVYFVGDSNKNPLVIELLRQREQYKRMLVFCNKKIKVRELGRQLQRKGFNVATVESGMEQKDREEVLRKFKNGSIPIVVATDVLSRGIDVKDIELVVNFDVPGDGEDYVHRIGRTARADTDGEAITLVNGRDRERFDRIEDLIGKKIERPDLPDWLQGKSADERRGGGGGRGKPDRGRGRDRNRGRGKAKRGDPTQSRGSSAKSRSSSVGSRDAPAAGRSASPAGGSSQRVPGPESPDSDGIAKGDKGKEPSAPRDPNYRSRRKRSNRKGGKGVANDDGGETPA